MLLLFLNKFFAGKFLSFWMIQDWQAVVAAMYLATSLKVSHLLFQFTWGINNTSLPWYRTWSWSWWFARWLDPFWLPKLYLIMCICTFYWYTPKGVCWGGGGSFEFTGQKKSLYRRLCFRRTGSLLLYLCKSCTQLIFILQTRILKDHWRGRS